MMVLKLILPTICLVLLVHPVISDIGNKWTKTVSDIEELLFKIDEVVKVDPSEPLFRGTGQSPLKSKESPDSPNAGM